MTGHPCKGNGMAKDSDHWPCFIFPAFGTTSDCIFIQLRTVSPFQLHRNSECGSTFTAAASGPQRIPGTSWVLCTYLWNECISRHAWKRERTLMSSTSMYMVSCHSCNTLPQARHHYLYLTNKQTEGDKGKQLAQGHRCSERRSWEQSLGHQVPKPGLYQEEANQSLNEESRGKGPRGELMLKRRRTDRADQTRKGEIPSQSLLHGAGPDMCPWPRTSYLTLGE